MNLRNAEQRETEKRGAVRYEDLELQPPSPSVMCLHCGDYHPVNDWPPSHEPDYKPVIRWPLYVAIIVVIAVAVAIAWLATSRGVVEASPQPLLLEAPQVVRTAGESSRADVRTAVGVLADTGAPVVPVSALRARGTATWYCGRGSACTRGYPASGLYAAAGSEIRAWRGELVRVRSGSRSVVVRLIDVCACKGSRVIDLYRGAFSRLADPSRGIIPVTVTLERALPNLPPTDTAS